VPQCCTPTLHVRSKSSFWPSNSTVLAVDDHRNLLRSLRAHGEYLHKQGQVDAELGRYAVARAAFTQSTALIQIFGEDDKKTSAAYGPLMASRTTWRHAESTPPTQLPQSPTKKAARFRKLRPSNRNLPPSSRLFCDLPCTAGVTCNCHRPKTECQKLKPPAALVRGPHDRCACLGPGRCS